MKRVRPAVWTLGLTALLAHGLLPTTALAQSSHSGGAATRSAPKPAPAPQTYDRSTQAMAWADAVAQRNQLDPLWVRSMVGQARFMQQIPRLMLPAPSTGGSKNWQAYRARFIEPIRLQAGARFWNAHADTLARAEAQFGVPAEMLMGILGVETLYGRHMGTLRVLDALATLTFDFPSAHPRAAARQAYFEGELEQFLLLCRELGLDPREPRGSYAGAMGLGQFMPSSWRRWAIDFDGDGRIDLFNSPADAIGSVANYFRAHGWIPGLPTHFDVQFDTDRLQLTTLMEPDILPTFEASRMAELGAVPLDAEAWHSGPLALIELQNGNQPISYVVGTRNFYAVTRYNWSSYYAMAVIDLGAELRDKRQESQP